jgi:phage baseplate assembly protein W
VVVDPTDPHRLMADNVPHLALPLRFVSTGFVTVQQDTLDEVRTSVAAIVAFPIGSRIEDPDFGVPEIELTDRPLDVDGMQNAIEDYEPRAAINVVELPYDPSDPLAARVRVEVALPGETEEVI